MALCKVSGTILDGTETPMANVIVVAFLVDAPQNSVTSSALISGNLIKAVTTSTGYFELNLVRNAKFCINIKEVGYKEIVTVPDADTLNLWSTNPAPDEPTVTPDPTNW